MTKSLSSSRRDFLAVGLSALACGIAKPALALTRPIPQTSRNLSFHNLNTDEKLNVTYWQNGACDRAGWAQINRIMRDHYAEQTHIMDLRLVDFLHDLQTSLQTDRPVEIISAYRAARDTDTNGGIHNSLHTQGKAVDIRIDGISLPRLHQTALNMNCGNVGFYPDSQFVHIDVGPRLT